MDFFGVCVLYSVRDVILVLSAWPQQDGPTLLQLHSYVIARCSSVTLATDHMLAVYSGWKSVDNYDTCASVFVVLFNGFVTHKLLWCYVQILTLQKPHIPASFNMYLVINKWVIAVKVSNFSGQYLRNRSTLDIGILGYIGIVWPKEHSPELWSVPPVTPCIHTHCIQPSVIFKCRK